MNWPDQDSDTSPQETIPESDASATALFENDTGELELDTRRVLMQLLAGPFIDQRRHPNLWPVLVRDEAVIRSRLSDLFMELVIDRDHQVAFTRQAETNELEVPTLLRRAQLTFIDSVLLLHLRQCLTQADAQGQRAAISVEEIMEHLAVYEGRHSTDHAGFAKRIKASIEKIKNHNILQKIRSSEDRYEISPTLKLLFSAEEIQALTRLYQQMSTSEVDKQAAQDEPADEGHK